MGYARPSTPHALAKHALTITSALHDVNIVYKP